MGVKLQSSSGGSVEIAAPVTASNYVLTAPAANGTILNDASSLAAAMLTGNVDVARLVSAFSGSNVSLATNGYQKLPSGLILQWTSVSITLNVSSGNTAPWTASFPITFPNGVIGVFTSHTGSTDDGTESISAVGGYTAAGITSAATKRVYGTYVAGDTVTIKIFAIGY